MPQNRLTMLVAGLVVVVLLLKLVVYEVNENQVAVVLTFGRATGETTESGASLKWPDPIQRVRHFDARQRVMKGPFEESLTGDGRSLLVGSFLIWRIASAQEFLNQVGDTSAAERHLRDLLRSAQSAEIAQVRFGELVSADPEQLRYTEVEARMHARIQAELATRSYGIRVDMVGIRRLGLPEDVTEAVFARMREERQALAAGILAQGRAEAGKIQAEAEARRKKLLSAAEGDARIALAEAERSRLAVLNRVAGAHELYLYLEKIEAIKKLLGEGGPATLLLDPSQPPFDLLSRFSEWKEGGKR